MSRFRTTEVSDPAYEHENLRFVTVKSPALKGRGDLSVFLPNGWKDMQDLPMLTLLHGVYGSHWVWPFKGGAHRTAQAMIDAGEIQPIVIAMPSDGLWSEGSAYLVHETADYESWIVDDVPAAVIENFSAVSPRSNRFIAGLSMGGYGALRLGAKYSKQFMGISAHSSITDFPQMAKFVTGPLTDYPLGQTGMLPAFDSLRENAESLPPLRFDCGNRDLLIEENRQLHRDLNEAEIVHTFEEFEGEHEWPYWIQHLRDSLLFFDRVASCAGPCPK